ncbi:2-polyprenyl-6-hydroxyphenyl methylase/3-demethylubiquinone-9 3-methyltransferase [Methylomarinovum caldicuralii]|uniref:2-polyprenyl-6-hydroxyphenyl methylase/3-demethylubiquinone-9 3-methyltransferase n=1 Tax=Methylomarinovum caldicuralii TaxID=438856 RepID=A0AAU9C0I8_9GAMM|nr:class I SAM-dependent methyltransferase [Methylomarinovum caldicuralii]BCX82180.1 2-polyprenyl-6-hydroxyphenyl methylase/3-demethylubiquinone-9 3-methyltransferase [Methylomarinovum caldicuralii]
MNANTQQAEARMPRRSLVSHLRGLIYDHTFAKLTIDWYRAVLERLPAGAVVLDVGIGTGGAVAANAALIRRKALQILGIDIDPDYVTRCRQALERAGLSEQVEVRLESVYDHQGGPYDAVYFSGSFMLLPDPVTALAHVLSLLKPEGRVYFTQTFHERRSPLAEKIKPMLHKVTTIHFGQVTYWDDFRRVAEAAGAEVVDNVVLGRMRNATFRLIEVKPRGSA